MNASAFSYTRSPASMTTTPWLSRLSRTARGRMSVVTDSTDVSKEESDASVPGLARDRARGRPSASTNGTAPTQRPTIWLTRVTAPGVSEVLWHFPQAYPAIGPGLRVSQDIVDSDLDKQATKHIGQDCIIIHIRGRDSLHAAFSSGAAGNGSRPSEKRIGGAV